MANCQALGLSRRGQSRWRREVTKLLLRVVDGAWVSPGIQEAEVGGAKTTPTVGLPVYGSKDRKQAAIVPREGHSLRNGALLDAFLGHGLNNSVDIDAGRMDLIGVD